MTKRERECVCTRMRLCVFVFVCEQDRINVYLEGKDLQDKETMGEGHWEEGKEV